MNFECHEPYKKRLATAFAIILLTAASTASSAKAEDTYFEKGKGLAKQGQYELAVAMFDRWITSHPSDADAYFYRGIALGNLKRQKQAIEDFNECIKGNPAMVGAYFNRSICLHDAGKFEDAIRDLNQAIALQPDNTDYYLQRAHIYLEHEGNRQEAMEDYKRVLALKPNEKKALEGLAKAKKATDATPVWTAHQVESTAGGFIVYVFADWCGPCKRMRPVFNEVVNEIRSHKFVMMNLDDKSNEAFLNKHNIKAVPTFLLIYDGEILRTCVGSVPKTVLEDFVYGRNDYDPFLTADNRPKASRRKANKSSNGRTTTPAFNRTSTNKLKPSPRKEPPKPVRLP